MKKEEFPTFLNEQPTVVFGRTTRELLILAIGLSCGYLIWQDITAPALGPVGSTILRVACGMVPVLIAIMIAFAKIATRPLEEWMVILFSYLVLPKIYLYMPLEDDAWSNKEQMEGEELLSATPLTEDDDDRYN